MKNPYTAWLENDLVALAKTGHSEAFAELVRRTRPRVMKSALSVVKYEDAAEDQVQNAYLKAWEQLPRFREDAQFATWITRIVINECLMTLRKQRRTPVYSLDEPILDEDARRPEVRDERLNAEEQLGNRQVSEVLALEMHRLPAPLRGPLVAAHTGNLSMAQVAARFGLSVEAAKTRLARARRELRRRMERHTGRLGAATLTA